MRGNELHFHIAREAGLEFVFNSGQSRSYPMHTHVSVFTLTAVRKGVVLLRRGTLREIHPAGALYVTAPHEAHAPAYSDGFDIVSVCVGKARFRHTPLPDLLALFTGYARHFADKGLLSAETTRLLAQGLGRIHDRLVHARTEEPAPDMLLAQAETAANPYAFIRRFKQTTGLTPHQYIIQNRVRVAKKLLTGAVAIADAAALAGFYDQSHLNRWFNRTLGITPLSYKASCVMLDP